MTRHGSSPHQAVARRHRPSKPYVPITSPAPFSPPIPGIIIDFIQRPFQTWAVIDQRNPQFVDPRQPSSCGNCPLLHNQIIKSP
jgi:hypothetical protein